MSCVTRFFILFSLIWCHGFAQAQAQAQAQANETGTIGVVLLHGKQGHTPRDTTLTPIASAMSKAGMLVVTPEMAWSFKRLMDKPWSMAVDEIKSHIHALRTQGASRIVLAGQSLGSPAILAYASKYDDIDALALISPGHTPKFFYEGIPFAPFRIWTLKNEVDRARDLVQQGQGDRSEPFFDINQGGTFRVWATPHIFLSYMAADSEAEMSLTALKIPSRVPVLWLIGKKDLLIREGSAYVFDKLPTNPRSKYLEVEGGHFDAGGINAALIVQWIQDVLAHPLRQNLQ